MRLVPLLSFLSFFLLLFSVNVDAQQKIAYVDFQDIFENYSETKAARDSVERYKNLLDWQYAVKEKDFRDWIEKIERTWSCATPNELEKIRENIKERSTKLEETKQQYEFDILKKEQTLLLQVKRKIEDIIQQLAIEAGYTQAVHLSDVLYKNNDGADDITQKVRKKLGM